MKFDNILRVRNRTILRFHLDQAENWVGYRGLSHKHIHHYYSYILIIAITKTKKWDFVR